ncbi:hypothetical protein FOXYSP1_19168 [Fusarium oxysporum f. sp. phaseoli]
MNDDDSDLFSWATDDEGANLDLTSQSKAIRDATPLGQIRNGHKEILDPNSGHLRPQVAFQINAL